MRAIGHVTRSRRRGKNVGWSLFTDKTDNDREDSNNINNKWSELFDRKAASLPHVDGLVAFACSVHPI